MAYYSDDNMARKQEVPDISEHSKIEARNPLMVNHVSVDSMPDLRLAPNDAGRTGDNKTPETPVIGRMTRKARWHEFSEVWNEEQRLQKKSRGSNEERAAMTTNWEKVVKLSDRDFRSDMQLRTAANKKRSGVDGQVDTREKRTGKQPCKEQSSGQLEGRQGVSASTDQQPEVARHRKPRASQESVGLDRKTAGSSLASSAPGQTSTRAFALYCQLNPRLTL